MHKVKIVVIVFIGMIAIWTVFALLPKPLNGSQKNPFLMTDSNLPRLIAHGGGNHEFPDNTLEAFYHAFSVDKDVMMETDVSLTKDGVIILSHDTTLDRKTSLFDAPIIETNYQDLLDQEIDFSYANHVEPNSNGFNVSRVHIRYTNYLGNSVTPLDVNYPEGVVARHPERFLDTTLEDLILAFPNNHINVEIKQSGEIGRLAFAKVIELLDRLDEEYNTYARIVLASFHREIYDEMIKLKETSHPMLMFSPEQQGVIKYYILQFLGLSFFYRDQVSVLQVPTQFSLIKLNTPSFIKTAQRHHIAVHYWTIDDEKTMRDLIEKGVDGIMTNRPTLLKEVIDSYRD